VTSKSGGGGGGGGGSGQLHAPAALPPGKESLDTHWIGGWVGPGKNEQ